MIQKKTLKTIKFTRPSTAIKHKKVLDKLVENGGSMRQAIIDVGYSMSVADNPSKITDSKSWKELTEEFLPDSLLAAKHAELFKQKQVEYFVFPKRMEDEEIKGHVEAAGLTVITIRESDKGKMAFYSIPNAQAIKGALELGYKVKGKTADETPPKTLGNTYNFIFSAPVQEKVKEMEEGIKAMLTKKPDDIQTN